LVLALLVMATVVAVAATLLIAWGTRDGAIDSRPRWHPLAQTFLASSMRVQPVPGWKTSVADLGLPNQSRFATSQDPFSSRPFVGNLGDQAYFVAGSPGAPDTQWWLIGIGVRDGRRLFAPVPLSSETRAPNCFLNGPAAVFCLRNDVQNVTAWVIDAHTGKVTYAGPTDLRAYPATLTVHQVGIYAVAETQHQGVYGVGPHANTTWFVPGDGSVDQEYLGNRDVAPLTIASQTTPGRGSNGEVVFSLSDGAVIKPELDANAEQQQTAVYPGGFAAEIAGSENPRQVEFFDDTGKRTGRQSIHGDLLMARIGSPDLPIVRLLTGPDHWAAYTPDGGQLLEAPGDTPQYSRLVGNRLFVQVSVEFPGGIGKRWQQYDLQTGAKGKACKPDMIEYIGSDGAVGVLADGNPNVGLVTTGMDLQTCDTLWTLKSAIGSFRQVWRINTTLVQLSDDGTELVSLVAPA
jgi:hypothetical protein